MLAILELNEFQKIINVKNPEVFIRMYYLEPGVVSVIPKNVYPKEMSLDMKIIDFELKGQLGEFLLYKYTGS